MNSRVGRQLAVKQQIADGQKIRVLRQLIDRVAAIQQLALIAVDECDRASAVGRRRKARIVREAAGLPVKIGDVDDVWSDRSGTDFELDLLIVDRQRCARLRRALGFSRLGFMDVHGCHLDPGPMPTMLRETIPFSARQHLALLRCRADMRGLVPKQTPEKGLMDCLQCGKADR